MDPIRRKFGETGFRVFRSAADALEVTVHTDWPSLEQARAYATSPDLKQGMQNAGVVSQPEVALLEAL
jgi:heme-degrading monooxygenase HmoA